MFLTKEGLQQLTGYKRNKEQKEWLKSKGYIFDENGRGELLIHVEYINQRLLGKSFKAGGTIRREPDEEALKKDLGLQ
jgi:hypothetical protein